jgi:hypothetical protein
VQARGQLRLTWRLYAESPQSGEISRLRVSIDPTPFPPIPARSPAQAGGKPTIKKRNRKRAVKK